MSLANQVVQFLLELGSGQPWGRLPVAQMLGDMTRVKAEFTRFLENGGRAIVQKRTFPLWRTVMLGRHQTPEAYLESIEGRGRVPNRWVRDIAAKTVCSQQEIDLPLVDVSGADLGFTEVYTYAQFLERAARFCLYRCPAETGLALADQFDDQPKGDYRRIGMEGITDSDGGLDVFYVYHGEDGLGLKTYHGHPAYQWLPGFRWVLTSRKP